MANIKITDLTAYGNPTSTDVLPIVDVGADVTKKVSVADLLENAGSGTAAAPGIAFDGDPDTGIYRPGADQVALSTGGTGRLFVDENGNVGIGASSITNLTGYAQLVLNGSNGGFIDIEDDGVTQARIIGSGNRLTLRTTETGGEIIFDSQTIKTTGVFSVAGGTADTPSIAFDGDSNTGIYRPGADQLAISTGGTGRLFVDALGNVAIGTTSITNLTDYAQLVLNNTNGGFIDIEDNGVTQARIIGSGNELTLRAAATGGAIIFDTDGSNERLRITGSGQLSIYGSGTSESPAVGFNGSAPSHSLIIDSSGRLLVGMSSQSGGSLFQVNDDRIRIASSKTPASASDTGTAGEICWDENYIYVCTATDTWKRAALSTW